MIYTVDGSVEGTEYGKLGVVENLITYQLEIYPSLAFYTQYVTNAPAIYTTIVAMTFLSTSGIFLLYDLAVKYKHNVMEIVSIPGDTVNTASRTESTGIPTRIQINQATTDLLIKSGKESWFKPRDNCIIAKGKGQMQTYWLIMTDFHASEGEDAFSFK